MRITIFGATGGTGRRLVRQSLDAGHSVTAVVRDPAKLTERHELLDVVRADVMDPESIGPAVKDADAVLSALGRSSGRDTTPVQSAGTRSIITAMAASGVRRLEVVSAAPVSQNDPGDGFIYRNTVRHLLRAILKDGYADMAVMEDEVRHSDLDWTIFRPPMLLDRPGTGRHRTAVNANLRGGMRIARDDLAAEMLLRLDDAPSVGVCVGLAY